MHRLPHLTLIVALGWALACSENKTRSPTPAPAETMAAQHQQGLRNAKAMVDNATLCEPESGVGNLEACRRACNLNHSNSCANWGQLMHARDPEAAALLYKRACVGGSGIGCEAQAQLLAKDTIETTNAFLNARRYHRVHCGQGYARSCSQLAHLVEAGLGAAPDTATSKLYFQRSCRLGVSKDCDRQLVE